MGKKNEQLVKDGKEEDSNEVVFLTLLLDAIEFKDIYEAWEEDFFNNKIEVEGGTECYKQEYLT